jgi:5-methylcytosine-specific restriction protein A
MFDITSLAEVTEVMASAAVADLGLVAPDELLSTVEGLERLRRYVDAVESHVLAKLDAEGTCDERFGLRTARWLADRAKLPSGVANDRVRLARRLRDVLPDTDTALSKGEVTVHHARVLSRAANPRIVDNIAEIELELLVLADRYESFDRWKDEIGRIADNIDADGGHQPDPHDPTLNKLHLNRGLHGELRLEGVFVGAHAAGVEEAVNRAADAQWRLFKRDAELTPELEQPGRASLLALGLAELVRHGHSARKKGTAVEPAADITVVAQAANPYRSGTTIYGAQISEQLMEFLGCGGEFAALVADSLGIPLDLGRSQRYANRAQRRALLHRHGGTCAFPGCSVPLHQCDIHHIKPWEAGGTTDIALLLPLCRHHHGVTHRKGWQLVTNPDHTYTWTTPLGDQLHSRPPPGVAAA